MISNWKILLFVKKNIENFKKKKKTFPYDQKIEII